MFLQEPVRSREPAIRRYEGVRLYFVISLRLTKTTFSKYHNLREFEPIA
jgi:hypothetical protein